MSEQVFLPGVDPDYALKRFALAGGNEVESGKLSSPESSAALAANCFAWFHHTPHLLPPFPGLSASWPATSVDIEYCARLPWSGGRHPWLDAMVKTKSETIGVESKRFEPFRSSKRVSFSEAYNRLVWGERMGPFERVRDALRSGDIRFKHLDAVQLVKHALGLLAESQRTETAPVLVYLYAEPSLLGGRPISNEALTTHRSEVQRFAEIVAGSEVRFAHTSYRDWLSTWTDTATAAPGHAHRLLETFRP